MVPRNVDYIGKYKTMIPTLSKLTGWEDVPLRKKCINNPHVLGEAQCRFVLENTMWVCSIPSFQPFPSNTYQGHSSLWCYSKGTLLPHPSTNTNHTNEILADFISTMKKNARKQGENLTLKIVSFKSLCKSLSETSHKSVFYLYISRCGSNSVSLTKHELLDTTEMVVVMRIETFAGETWRIEYRNCLCELQTPEKFETPLRRSLDVRFSNSWEVHEIQWYGSASSAIQASHAVRKTSRNPTTIRG